MCHLQRSIISGSNFSKDSGNKFLASDRHDHAHDTLCILFINPSKFIIIGLFSNSNRELDETSVAWMVHLASDPLKH